MGNLHGGVILHDGYLYGSGDYKRGWYCLDFKTGKQMWKEQGMGTLIYADGIFYCLEDRGMVKLVKATPEKYEVASSFQSAQRRGRNALGTSRGMWWTVICASCR